MKKDIYWGVINTPCSSIIVSKKANLAINKKFDFLFDLKRLDTLSAPQSSMNIVKIYS